MLSSLISGIIIGIYLVPFLIILKRYIKDENLYLFFNILFIILFVLPATKELTSVQTFYFGLIISITSNLIVENYKILFSKIKEENDRIS